MMNEILFLKVSPKRPELRNQKPNAITKTISPTLDNEVKNAVI